ncbi:oligosaccharide flippase family protein [Actinoplanes sp. NPDC049548]|uniref:lipopolysaccharide biosynthesis protein n=1 Tax=Actinoplanes sp. NPDC049548 TaxID=3155152 RepID=UPI00343D2FEB
MAWSFSGNAVYAATQLLVAVVIARLGDNVMLGQYALGLAVAAPMVLLASLSLRTVLVTDSSEKHPVREYVLLRAVGMCAALCLVGAVALAVYWPDSAAVVVVLVGTAKAVDGMTDLFVGVLQRREMMREVAVSWMVNGTLTALFMTVLLSRDHGIVSAVGGSVLASLCSLAYCIHTVWRPSYGPAWWRAAGRTLTEVRSLAPGLTSLARTAAPLGAASCVTSLTANVPRYVVGHSEGAGGLGVFSAVGYAALAANVAIMAVAQTVLPRMARLHASGRLCELRRLVARLLAGAGVFSVLATAGCLVLGGRALELLYGSGYRSYGPVLALLILAVGVGAACFFLDAGLSAGHRFRSQLVVNILALGMTLVSASSLTALYGLSGAAWSVVISILFQCLVKAALFRRAVSPHRAAAGKVPR